MSRVVLSEVRLWLPADTITGTAAAAANMPAANLKTPDLGLRWRDTSSADAQGFEWDYNDVSQDAWAICIAGMNSPPLGNRAFTLRLSSATTYSGAAVVADATSYALTPEQIYGATGTPSIERADALICYGIDTLDDTPVTVDGTPKTIAHKSGRLEWAQGGQVMPDGYHEAAYLAVGLKPIELPEPSEVALPELITLRRGYGWRVTLGWSTGPMQMADEVAVRGLRELASWALANQRRPVLALLDTTGLDDGGQANSTESAPWLRLGLARIVAFSAPTPRGPVGSARWTWDVSLTLETWEERPAEITP